MKTHSYHVAVLGTGPAGRAVRWKAAQGSKDQCGPACWEPSHRSLPSTRRMWWRTLSGRAVLAFFR